MGDMRNACKTLGGKPKRTKAFGRPRCQRENNIKTNLKKVEFESMDWIHLAPVRFLVNTVTDVLASIKGMEFTEKLRDY